MTSDDEQPTIYVVYNAKGTLLGKVDYVYRKATCPNQDSTPACAACELTHGPSLRLTETTEWAATKARIHHATIKQVHTDERPAVLARWMNKNGVSTPAVIVDVVPAAAATDDHKSERFQVLLTAEDLSQVRRNHAQFLQLLEHRCTEAGIPKVKVEAA